MVSEWQQSKKAYMSISATGPLLLMNAEDLQTVGPSYFPVARSTRREGAASGVRLHTGNIWDGRYLLSIFHQS